MFKNARFPLKALIGSLLAVTAMASNAAVVYSNSTPTGAMGSPGSISAAFSTGGGAGDVTMQIRGYLSLDGVNCCTDTFTVDLDGTTLFSGAFNMGGGGTNTIFANPNGATWSATSLGLFAGGELNLSVPVAFSAGSHRLILSYTGGDQGLGDEGWGVNWLTVNASTSSAPEPATLTLLGLSLLGVAATRRRARR